MKIALAVIVLTLCSARGSLIETSDYDLFVRSTSGNYTEFFDEARIIPYFGPDGQWHDPHGWVSLYGALNGGTNFFTDLFTLADTTTVNVSWDFTGTGYSMVWLYAFSADENVLFRIGRDRIVGTGSITLPSGVDGISFYGKSPSTRVPEGGKTYLLLLIPLGLLAATRFYFEKLLRKVEPKR